MDPYLKALSKTIIAALLMAPPVQGATEEVIAEVQDLPTDLPAAFSARLTAGSEIKTLILRRHPVRADGFRLLTRRDDGVHELAAPPERTYSGRLVEEPHSRVVAALLPQGLRGFIQREDGSRFLLRPDSSTQRARLHRFFPAEIPSFVEEDFQLAPLSLVDEALAEVTLPEVPTTKGVSGPP